MRIKVMLVLLALIYSFLAVDQIYAAQRSPVNISETSKLPLRVLTRPAATLYKDQSGKTALKSNLPSFSSYFVYTRPAGELLATGEGWYEVGSDDKGTVVGWLKAEDVFEWKQTMCLAYTHPEGRHPVLMFEDDDYLKTLIESSDDLRSKTASEFYKAIDEAASASKPLPKNFPITSIEPKMAVDLAKNFTLLPILDHEAVEIEEREARLLRIAAISSSAKDRQKSDIRSDNIQYLKHATTTSSNQVSALKDISFDVVWVIDTTRSMGPYIEKAREVMRGISKTIADRPELAGKVAFGAWGYRDSSEIEGLEYVTHNFTPKLLPVDQFLTAMEDIKETSVDSRVFDEDVFSGVNDAINKTAWRENSIRIIILVGDAPSHLPGHKWNASGLDQETLRSLANERHITFYALHLNHPKAKKYNKVAAKQFKTLSQNPGNKKSMYWAITDVDLEAFANCSKDSAESIAFFASEAINAAKKITPQNAPEPQETPFNPPAGGEMAALEGEDNDQPENQNANPTRQDIRRSLQAASVTWLGSQTNVTAPRDIEAYVVDKDLINPTQQSLEVRLLLTKAQLDTLATLLKDVMTAGATNQVSGEDFFNALQAASAVAARDPEMLSKATSLGASGLIPSFLQGLPYKSRLMDMNNELWASWSPDEQDAFLNNLEAKVKAYQSIHDDSALWIALNEGDDPADFVAPVPLELMP
ncbi:MAG: VWA domain-containing protein [Desulfovibrionaceae bacterium]|nr:VWA domain-containing protein [Desulfovibrionaceae bacterium]